MVVGRRKRRRWCWVVVEKSGIGKRSCCWEREMLLKVEGPRKREGRSRERGEGDPILVLEDEGVFVLDLGESRVL